jgi:hypothetical protein
MNPASPLFELTKHLKLLPILRLLENVNVRFGVGGGLIALQFPGHHAVVKLRFDRDGRGDLSVNEMIDEMLGLAVFPLFRVNCQGFFPERIGIALGQFREGGFGKAV